MNNRKNIFHYIGILIITIILVSFTAFAVGFEENISNINEKSLATTSEDYIPSETVQPTVELKQSNYVRIISIDLDILNAEKEKCSQRMIDAESMEKIAKETFNYSEDHPVIKLAKNEWISANEDYKFYDSRIKKIEEEIERQRWEKKAQEYPVATTIWLNLKEKGYSDYVCAGLIGNMMTETGGQTLNIRAEIYDTSGYFYGICQWNGGGYASVHGQDLLHQIDFLDKTIKQEVDTFGYAYASNFNFDKFLAMENEQEVAIAFAKTYERCDSASYWNRRQNATVAYNYFVNE